MIGPRARHPRGKGASGMLPCAYLEVWAWRVQDGRPRVTFGGSGPHGSPEWRAAVWRSIASEALAVAQELEGSRPAGER